MQIPSQLPPLPAKSKLRMLVELYTMYDVEIVWAATDARTLNLSAQIAAEIETRMVQLPPGHYLILKVVDPPTDAPP